MSRYRYNRQVSPPAPFIHVSVRSIAVNSAVAECPAQLDTAADLTVIPSRLVDELQLDQLSELPILGVGAHLATLPTFLVQKEGKPAKTPEDSGGRVQITLDTLAAIKPSQAAAAQTKVTEI